MKVSAIKAFFLSRLLREKILLVLFVFAAAAMWLTSAGKRTGRFWREVSLTSSDLAEQRLVLDAKNDIEARAEAAIAQLDPSRTFDNVRLLSELNAIAAAAGISSNRTIGDSRSDRTTQFAVHTVQVTMRNVDYAALVKFYLELQKRAPYLGIEQFDVFASPANGALLTASLRISSVEIAR